jgi:hypothetical protein
MYQLADKLNKLIFNREFALILWKKTFFKRGVAITLWIKNVPRRQVVVLPLHPRLCNNLGEAFRVFEVVVKVAFKSLLSKGQEFVQVSFFFCAHERNRGED